MTEEISLTAADGGRFTGYLARPAGGTGPGVLVLQEIFGVNPVMRELCDRLAADGYLALCPDLFWRQEPGVQITDRTEAEWARAFALMQGFDLDLGIQDAIAALAALRGLARPQGSDGAPAKAGCVGYCLGGKLAYLMATRSDVDCSVSYYGVGLDALLGEATAIRQPLLMHVADLDRFTPPPARDQILAGLRDHPLVTIHRYPGVDHAFARVGGAHYDPAAATLANQRSAEFLARLLK